MMKKILYAALGLVLLASVFFTAEDGLQKDDHDAYVSALALQPAVERLGFDQFKLADYPVSFYNGKDEAVIQGEHIESRRPILGVLAATTWKVEDHYEIFMPTYEDLRRLFYGITDKEVVTFGTVEHVAVLWHEAFHAWHLSRDETTLDARYGLPNLEDTTELLRKAIDDDPKMRDAYTKELALLYDAVRSGSRETQVGLFHTYLKLRKQRLAQLPPEIETLEDFYELTEGGAHYVEAMVYLEQTDEGRYNNRYLIPAGEYAEGPMKYYRSGFLKYRLLDQCNPDWKKDFSDSQNVTAQLIATLGDGG